jgi:hypothetical protein
MIVPAVVGLAIIPIILWDAFETIVLPRRVTHPFRLARMFYRATWTPWQAIARSIRKKGERETLP